MNILGISLSQIQRMQHKDDPFTQVGGTKENITGGYYLTFTSTTGTNTITRNMYSAKRNNITYLIVAGGGGGGGSDVVRIKVMT